MYIYPLKNFLECLGREENKNWIIWHDDILYQLKIKSILTSYWNHSKLNQKSEQKQIYWSGTKNITIRSSVILLLAYYYHTYTHYCFLVTMITNLWFLFSFQVSLIFAEKCHFSSLTVICQGCALDTFVPVSIHNLRLFTYFWGYINVCVK